MRHFFFMKAILTLSIASLLCSGAETSSEVRAAVDKTISALNVWPMTDALFTTDADSDLGKLPQVDSPQVRQLEPDAGTLPHVVISKQPWGEAQINLPGVNPPAPVEVVNPRITSGAVRLITADVAVVEGTWTYNNGGKQQTIPLLFVMRKDAGAWRIAAARILAH